MGARWLVRNGQVASGDDRAHRHDDPRKPPAAASVAAWLSRSSGSWLTVRGNPIAMAIQDRLGGAFEPVLAAVTKELTRVGGSAPWRGKLRALVVRATR